jgi:hypothetical protein
MQILDQKQYNSNKIMTVSFDIHYASTNTRLKAFENPVVVDNKTILIISLKRYHKPIQLEVL